MKRVARLFSVLLLLAQTLALQPFALPVVHAQAGPTDEVKQLMARMSPQQKVGQLFLVSFAGRDASPGTPIYDLIAQSGIGGVLLKGANDNFTGPSDTVSQVYSLTGALQSAALGVPVPTPQPTAQGTASPTGETNPTAAPAAIGTGQAAEGVPLLIGLAESTDGYLTGELLNGTSALPSQMAIGATWDTTLAEQVGNVLGNELQAMGINLFLGPALDVVENPPLEGGNDMGVGSFGGNPFWVGRLGQAIIAGIHHGSAGRVAVVAGHFPGMGDADRPPAQEIPTVRKPLEELQQVELSPFFAVTGRTTDPAQISDALLAANIRYQGLQGNIRANTRPADLDAGAMQQLLALPDLATWRSNGGVLVSDDLASRALRLFFDPSGQTFDLNQVALAAFLAGNDVLNLGSLPISPVDNKATSMLSQTLSFFAQKYSGDAAFAQRVDQSVARILRLKLKLYPHFDPSGVFPDPAGLGQVGQSGQLDFDVERVGASLLSPQPNQLADNLSGPPARSDHVVIITDVLSARQCSRCEMQPRLGTKDFENVIMRLYGPQGGGMVYGGLLTSYTFGDLRQMLDDPSTQKQLESDIRSAQWVVFLMRDVSSDRPDSQAVKRLLAQRLDLLGNKRLVAFALGAPYYLDATEVSKLSAYYGLFEGGQAALEIAARLLFQEINAQGASPVSVAGTGYRLLEATSPDPSQVIGLFLDTGPSAQAPAATAPAQNPTLTPAETGPSLSPTPGVIFKVGDVLPLRTGVITDHNGHVVPDGTVVQFIFATEAGLGGTQQIQAETQGGVARVRYRISTPGLIEVRAESEPATSSDVLRLDVSPTEGGVLEAFTPTPKPSPTPTQAPTPTATAVPTPVPAQGNGGKGPLFGWLLNALLSWGMGLAFFVVGGRALRFVWLRRAAPYVLVVGLLAYLWMLLGLPGSMPLDPPGSAALAALVSAFAGALVAMLLIFWPNVWTYFATLGRKSSAHEAENEPGDGEK